MEKPIISLWGFGPSYRRRVKLNILDAISMGYDNMMDYVILTDYPEDFLEFAEQTGKVKAIINVHNAREPYPWSKDLEFIPSNATDPDAYGEEYKTAMSIGHFFSYSAHRFSFPTISQLGYKKIVFMDGDVKIRYDKIVNGTITEEEFWEEFNTPVNSMKGCVKETLGVDPLSFDSPTGSYRLRWSMAMGSTGSLVGLQACSIVLDKLFKQKNIFDDPFITQLSITEGPFRYYHFESPEKVKNYFDIWNECIKIFYGEHFLKACQQCGGYMLCDYMPVATTNIFHKIEVLNFPNTVYNRQIHFEDRYFMPPSIPGFGGNFAVGTSLEDFMEKNKEIKDMMDQHNAWPHTEPY
jgi:hypothetical protein